MRPTAALYDSIMIVFMDADGFKPGFKLKTFRMTRQRAKKIVYF